MVTMVTRPVWAPNLNAPIRQIGRARLLAAHARPHSHSPGRGRRHSREPDFLLNGEPGAERGNGLLI